MAAATASHTPHLVMPNLSGCAPGSFSVYSSTLVAGTQRFGGIKQGQGRVSWRLAIFDFPMTKANNVTRIINGHGAENRDELPNLFHLYIVTGQNSVQTMKEGNTVPFSVSFALLHLCEERGGSGTIYTLPPLIMIRPSRNIVEQEGALRLLKAPKFVVSYSCLKPCLSGSPLDANRTSTPLCGTIFC
jgi:hypothetical protein